MKEIDSKEHDRVVTLAYRIGVDAERARIVALLRERAEFMQAHADVGIDENRVIVSCLREMADQIEANDTEAGDG